MSRLLQIILGLFGLLVVLVLAAVIIIPLVVDPNDYRDHIARGVEEDTGRSFEIEGEISLSVFPWLGLEVGRMRLGNPPGFDEAPFVEIGSAAVGAKLLPLLSRRLEISTLRLDGLRVNLVKLADGSANWEGLGGDDAAPSSDRAPSGGAPAGDGSFSLDRIGGLRLSDAIVRYEDRQQGSVVEAALPRLVTGELAPGQPFPLEAEAMVTLDEGATRIAAKLEARVRPARDGSAATLEGTKLDGEISAGAARQSFELRVPTVDLALAGPTLELQGLELDFQASGPEVPGGSQAGRLAAPTARADLDAQTLSIPSFSVELAGLRLAAELDGTRIVDAPSFAGRLEIAEFSPRALLQRLGEEVPVTADGAVLGKAALNARFRAGTETVELEDLVLLLDDTRLTGNAAVGVGAVTRVRAQLALDAIDLDRYLPPEPETPPEEAPAGDVALAFDWLKGLDLDASFRAGRLKVNGLTLTELDARAVAREGVLTLQPFAAALYGGQVRGSARLDARQAPATFSLDQSLSALQLLPFVQDLAGFDRLTGVAQLTAKLSTSAASTAGLASGLNGELSFDVSDGAFKGVNLWYEIQRANALARGRAAPVRSSSDTDFRQLRGTAVIRDGKLVNQDLVGGLPFLALAGQGEVDLAGSVLDYRLTATVIREAIDEATGERSELAGASLPLRLRGSLDSPSVSVDLGGVLRDRVQQEALQRLGVQEEDRKAAEEELKDRALDRVRRLQDRLRRDD